MEFWIVITLAAAFFQNLRSAVQKKLSGDIGALASAYSRFIFALPFALFYLFSLYAITDVQFPQPNSHFLLYILAGGSAQILGTTFLIMSFKDEQYAQGTAFSKTEVVQVAIIGFIVLGEAVGLPFVIGVLISFAGILGLIGLKEIVATQSLKAVSGRVALLGITSGTGFALSAVAYRGASLALGGPLEAPQRAAFTLACVLGFQTLAMGLYLFVSHRSQLKQLVSQWRTGLIVGLAGMLASTGWFTALAMQSAAYVRALGQVELIFAMLTSVFLFREGLKLTEVFSIFILSAGILIILLGG